MDFSIAMIDCYYDLDGWSVIFWFYTWRAVCSPIARGFHDCTRIVRIVQYNSCDRVLYRP